MTTIEIPDRVAEHVQDFLRAEQAASELVDQLEHLRAETAHYQTARTALDQVAQGVAGSASTLGDLSGRVAEVIDTLRSIGTPELRAGQEQLARSVDALATNVGSLDAGVAHQVTTVVQSLEAVGRLEASLHAAAADVKRQRSFVTMWSIVLLLAVVVMGVLPLVLHR